MTNPSTLEQQHNHRKLLAWQQAMILVEDIYRITKTFPRDEAFGLTSQIRRSAVSVPSNIAEGAGRNSTKELVQFLGIASGSLAEADTQLEIATRLGYLDRDSSVFNQMSRVGQLLVALRKSLRSQ
jgi:four helix bundle protein